jgi:hypothetical protein
MSIATNNLRLAHAKPKPGRRRKRDLQSRALWDAATKEGGLAPSRVRWVLWLSGPESAFALDRAIRDRHLIEVRRHTIGGVVTLYQPFGPRP